MILYELKKYFDKRNAVTSGEFFQEGYEKKEIPFLIVIDDDGNLINLQDTRRAVKIPMGVDKKTNKPKEKTILKANSYLLPRSVPRSGSRSYETTFLLWDHAGYVLKHPETDKKTPKQHQTWLNSLQAFPDALKTDRGIAAIIKFYEKSGIDKVKKHTNWKDCEKIKACNITFILVDDLVPIPCRDAVKSYLQEQSIIDLEASKDEKCVCLVTGNKDNIARISNIVIFGGNIARLISFQKNSGYDSYGKEQGGNAPIGKRTEIAYTTALKSLLESEQKVVINATTFLFWAETPDEYEGYIVDVFKDDPDKRTNAVKALLDSPKSGVYVENVSKKRFFVLGISPNKGRISVKFWFNGTIGELSKNIRQHFQDTKIIKYHDYPETLSLSRLLVSSAILEEKENIPPNLSSELMKSIITGLKYSDTLFLSAIRHSKIKAKYLVNDYARAAIIKAYLNRFYRFYKQETRFKELTVSLDKENTNPGYLLGRLFAVLEKVQSEANPGINATIRDRFYAAASGTPASVFSNLMRLKNHHLSKLENKGRRVNLEQLIGEIVNEIQGEFPSHLSLHDQGCFAIGYYHQMRDFYRKKGDAASEKDVATPETEQ